MNMRVLTELRAALGAGRVLTGPDVAALDPGWDADNLRAGVLVQPGTPAEVAAVVGICRNHGIGVVPHGGRTGLVGGGRSAPGQVVLSLARLNRIEFLDPGERVAVVEAGVTLQALQAAAAGHGLEPGVDLAARGSATIGGLVSTNAGGIMAFRHGVMRHQVLGMEAVLANGTTYRDLGRVVKNNAGYDLKQLFIGAEGTLGIVTRVALKLWPTSPATESVLLALPSIEAASTAVRLAMSTDGAALRAAEIMWQGFFRTTAAAAGWSDSGLDMGSPLFLLIGLEGIDPVRVRAAIEGLFAELTAACPGVTGVLAGQRRQEDALWRLREDTETLYHLHPAAPSHDVSVPLSAIPGYVARIRAELAALDSSLDPYIFGHLADGNLHVVLNRAGALVSDDLTTAVSAILYRGLHAAGGSFSAEHGIGAKRLAPLVEHADPVKLALMRSVKRALDPLNLLNPGKVVPEQAT